MTESEKVTLRNATVADLDSVQRIEDISFGDYDDPFSRNIFLRFLRKYPDGFRVAELDSKIVGYCYTSPPEVKFFSRYRKSTIYSLAVSPEARNQGIGSTLLADAIDSLRGKQVELELQVAVFNVPAQNLYKKFGFELSETRHNYYGAGKHAFEMKLMVP